MKKHQAFTYHTNPLALEQGDVRGGMPQEVKHATLGTTIGAHNPMDFPTNR